MKLTYVLVLAAVAALVGGGCHKSTPATGNATAARPLTIGVAFETLQTEYWVAGLEAIRSDLKGRGYTMLEAVADNDANRQIEQVRNFITRRVDGIILVPKDAQTCLPMIKSANAAGIPIVLFNRPPAESTAKSVTVVADNYTLARETVAYLVDLAHKSGHKQKAMILIGDLGDINATQRRQGFDDAIKGNEAYVDVVARVPTEWSQEKAQSGVVNALQANPDIGLIFTSSDFLLPSIVSALKSQGKYHRADEPGHVILGGFDGDATAYAMLRAGYLDATGVQDVFYEAQQCVEAVINSRDGKPVPAMIKDPGFVITRDNVAEKSGRMWGAVVGAKAH